MTECLLVANGPAQTVIGIYSGQVEFAAPLGGEEVALPGVAGDVISNVSGYVSTNTVLPGGGISVDLVKFGVGPPVYTPMFPIPPGFTGHIAPPLIQPPVTLGAGESWAYVLSVGTGLFVGELCRVGVNADHTRWPAYGISNSPTNGGQVRRAMDGRNGQSPGAGIASRLAVPVAAAGQIQNLAVKVTVNTMTAAVPVRVLLNGVATGLVISIAAGFTGVMPILGSAIAVVVGDRIEYEIDGSGDANPANLIRVSATTEFAQ